MFISTLQHNSATIECDIFTLTWEIYGFAFQTFAHNPCSIIRLPKPRRSRRSTGQRGQAGCTHDIWLPSHSNTMSSLLTTEQLEELGRCMLSIIQARYAMMAVYCLQVYEWLATCVFRFFLSSEMAEARAPPCLQPHVDFRSEKEISLVRI